MFSMIVIMCISCSALWWACMYHVCSMHYMHHVCIMFSLMVIMNASCSACGDHVGSRDAEFCEARDIKVHQIFSQIDPLVE